MLPTASDARTGRSLLKRFIYSQLSLLDAGKILLNKAQPLVPFTVKAEPASVYYNFRIKPDAREAFIRYINLPAGFDIVPVKCLQGDQSDYLLTLNVYEVSGIATGIRAEWSTYIRDHHGIARYMVLEARSSTRSMDPVDVITPKSRVEHETQGGHTRTTVASIEGRLFSASFAVAAQPAVALIHQQWVTANDYIYWRNGICDRVFYDTGMAYPDASLIEPANADIDDQTHWAQFIDAQASHVIQFTKPIEFVIMPWFNVSSPAGKR